jgi:poly-gamma-glutamate synthesis protein (capsule biosynthesis protein)
LSALLTGGCAGSDAPRVADVREAGGDAEAPVDSRPEDARPAAAPAAKAESLELTFVGDIIFGRYRRSGRFDPIVRPSRAKPFAKIAPVLKSDVVVGNLETPVVERLPHTSPIGMRYRFGGSRAMVRDYLEGFDVLGMANNHYFDLRMQGQQQGPRILAEEGILAVGAPQPAGTPYRVETFTTKRWRIGLLAVTTVVNAPTHARTLPVPQLELGEMPATLLPIVEAARADHDLLVVLVHWGDEYQDKPSRRQRQVAHALIEGGVDMVIGHHPHVLQAIERHQGGLIAYSLGNLLFGRNGLPRLMGVLRTRWSASAEGTPWRGAASRTRTRTSRMARRPAPRATASSS